MRPVYLDNNATTRTDPAVVAAMLPYFTEQFGNASSEHLFGSGLGEAMKDARNNLRALIGAVLPHEIIFTSGGTESDNAAILSALETQAGRDEIVTTNVEHSAILTLVTHLERIGRAKVHIISVDRQGRLDEEAFARALGPRTAIASVMWANNETGTIFPVDRLAKMAHSVGALFHTDAVQAVGKMLIDLKSSEIDMLSLSGHKLHGPKGIGALYVRKGVKFASQIRGGHQERGRRGGTENVPSIIGLGKAAELAMSRFDEETTRVRALRDRLEDGILRVGGPCFVNGDKRNRLPNTSNIAFDGLDGEAILTHMSRAGIAASSGSACTSGSTEPSHVLRAMSVPVTALHGAIRLSLSRDNTDADVDRVLEVLPGIIAKLRAMLPSVPGRPVGSNAQSYM
ncbi:MULTISPECIES: cysteine desulfurase NifS [unclassified Hyphomicrobium]|uniref:cysteine desulfurase NifS n=1 Tax=unclassified Hyphomicrobium TaxID=2619925 RepID=UPI0002E09D68|nr:MULTISPECIES: cysteine desulfurase NifS [unclassified Hyphomicrobium]